MQSLKHKTNEQSLSQKHTHRDREHTDGCQREKAGERKGTGERD